jgi:hypothetical protein
MSNGTNKESGESCPPGASASPESSVTRPPQILMAVALAAAIGGLLGALIGAKLAR